MRFNQIFHENVLLVILLLLLTSMGWSSETAAGQLQLAWNDNSTNEDGFKIERKTGTTGSYAQITVLGANVSSYTDSALVDGATYCYRVRAYNSEVNSPYAPEACGTTKSSVQIFTLTVEAEAGRLTAPMVNKTDAQSGVRYVNVPQGTGNNYNDATNGGPGEVSFSITIPQAGTYALWARTLTPNLGSDSFYVTGNGSRIKEWHVGESTTWQWQKVAHMGLLSGPFSLAFRQREDGAKLDQIHLTHDLNSVPGSN